MNSIERTQGAKPAIFKSPRALWTAIARASGATLPLSSQQVTSHQVKIGQRGGHEQAMRVLGQATVTHFGKAEDALDDADGVLDLGSDPRLGAILGALFRRQVAIATTTLLGEVLGLRRLLPDQCLLSGVTGVTVDPPLAAVQQVRQRMLVMHVGRTRRHRMNELGLAVHADVRLHPDHWLPFCVCFISGSRSPSLFLVELGALMIVASTMVPVATLKPWACKWALTAANSCRPRSWLSSIWRKRRIVVSSGAGSRPRSMPTNCRIASESYNASSAAGSDRLNHCCRK